MTDLTNRPLAGKTAVVTGAGRGIGRACALCLASAGANLVLLEKDDAPLREATEAIEKLASRPLPLQLDCTSETEVERGFAAARKHAGRIDILVNNVGQSARERATGM